MTAAALDVKKLFIEKEALLEGHFILSSGLHSDRYLQAAKVLQYPDDAARLGRALGELYKHSGVEVVVAPAVGGILVSFEVARALGVRSIFVERAKEAFELRRGFEIRRGEKILIVEDVVTTGGSTKEVVDLVTRLGGRVLAAGSIIDRSGGRANPGVPFKSLLAVEAKTYEPSACPACREGRPAVKPGSRPR